MYYHLKEQFPAALQYYDKALALDPDNIEIIWWKACDLWAYGKKEESIDLLDNGLKIDQEDYNLLNTKGELLRELNKPEEALTIFKKIKKIYPKNLTSGFK